MMTYRIKNIKEFMKLNFINLQKIFLQLIAIKTLLYLQ